MVNMTDGTCQAQAMASAVFGDDEDEAAELACDGIACGERMGWSLCLDCIEFLDQVIPMLDNLVTRIQRAQRGKGNRLHRYRGRR